MKKIFFLLPLVIFAQEYTITPNSVNQIKKICNKIKPGDEIILKSGIYTQKFPIIKCKGSKNANVTIKADGKVTIKKGWIVKGKYLTIENLNFKGNNDNLDYKKVIKNWWHPKPFMRQIGMLIEGDHITLKNNIIGNFPGAGVKFKGKSDYLTIDHNIIYNNAWWTTGGTGGLVIKNIQQTDNSKKAKVKITNNLFFANESRIISHVFKKGFAKMVIDEGESFLIQQKDDASKKGAKRGKYNGRYLVKNNLILYNGKGSSLNKADNIDLIENDFYCNGTTSTSKKAGGIRGNNTNNDNFIDNAIQTCGNKKAISVKGKNNRFINNKTGKIYKDPQHLNFYNVYFKNRANKLFESFKPMLNKYNIKVKPTNYKVNLQQQIKDIISLIPKKADTKIIKLKDKIIIKNIDNSNIKGLGKNFILKF